MDRYVLVALGSALGGMARLFLTEMGAVWWGAEFPWGTLVINVVGSAVIGGLAGTGISSSGKLLLMTGVCGGFTTFSAFSLQTLVLVEKGAVGAAAAYVALSVGICVAGCWVGYLVAKGV